MTLPGIFDTEAGSTTGPAPIPAGDTLAPGTYIKISTPNFLDPIGATTPPNPMGSYLRIGAIEDAALAGNGTNPTVGGIDPTGEDLAALVKGFADDQRAREAATPAPMETAPPGTTAMTPGSMGMPGTPIAGGTPLNSTTLRGAESAALHSKGGWRDHTDGNRISTTRGDKVEVIRGNYKMIVLGRRDPVIDPVNGPDLSSAAGWDLSGGLVNNLDLNADAMHPAMELTYSWEQGAGGMWGWTQTTKIGSDYGTLPGGARAVDPHATGVGNGKIISTTFADEIRQTYGSTSTPVDTLHIENHAVEMETLNTAVNTFELDVAAQIIQLQIAVGILELKTAVHTDIHLGDHVDAHFGEHTDCHVGHHTDAKTTRDAFSLETNELHALHNMLHVNGTTTSGTHTHTGDTLTFVAGTYVVP